MRTANDILAQEGFANCKQQFPILQQTINNLPLVYLDSAASAQKPRCVIDALVNMYENDYANVHRGVHTLSERSTAAYERARHVVKDFLHASSDKEIVFVRGTTEAINLVANTYGLANLGKGDEIIISAMEHHANIVPWQMLCERTGAVLRVIPMTMQGELELNAYADLLTAKTKLVAITHVSNALGTINPVATMIEMAHAHGAVVLLDGAQAAPHMPIDVQALNCDFYAFSAHKVFGPTGIGALYGKQTLLDAMPPYQGGGDMIKKVTFAKTTYQASPFRFEAGTPNIVGTIGFAAALEFLQKLDMLALADYENALLAYATQSLQTITDLRIIGTASAKVPVISFVLGDVHAHDVGTIVDKQGVAVRTGHHCAMPIMQHFDVPATVRASFAMYNTTQDVDQLVSALLKVQEVFHVC